MKSIDNIYCLINITDFTPTEKSELSTLFSRFDPVNQDKLLGLIIDCPDLLRLFNENVQIKKRAQLMKNNNLWQNTQRQESVLLKQLAGNP